MSISLTIDNLNEQILGRLNSEAQRRGIEVKVLVEEILRQKFLIEETVQKTLNQAAEFPAVQRFHDLDSLAGTWSKEETDDFLAAVANMRQCDEELWK
jgi:hypothetical protein